MKFESGFEVIIVTTPDERLAEISFHGDNYFNVYRLDWTFEVEFFAPPRGDRLTFELESFVEALTYAKESL